MANTAAEVCGKFNGSRYGRPGETCYWNPVGRPCASSECRVRLRVTVPDWLTADKPLEQTVICGAELRRPAREHYSG